MKLTPEIARALEREVMAALAFALERVRFCPECGEQFLAVTTRQQYCGVRCSNTGRQRTWVKGHPDLAKQRRRAAYERRKKRGTR